MTEIMFPFPPSILSPNTRAHWRKKAKAAKLYKEACFFLTKSANMIVPQSGPMHLWIDFCPPDRRKRDDDNVAAAFKSGRDGLALALGVDDSRFVSHPYLCDYSPDFTGVKVRISDGPK